MTEEQANAIVDAMGPFLALPVAAEWRPGVIAHLQAAQRIAGPLLALPVEDHAEPAPVYTP